MRKRRRSRTTKVLEATYTRFVREHGHYPTTAEMIEAVLNDESPMFSMADHAKAWRSLVSERVDSFLKLSVGGQRQFLPVEIGGARRWIPHGKADESQLENYHRHVDRPNVDAVERAYRRRGIELEILRQEGRFRASLTAESVEDLVEQAFHWLST